MMKCCNTFGANNKYQIRIFLTAYNSYENFSNMERLFLVHGDRFFFLIYLQK